MAELMEVQQAPRRLAQLPAKHSRGGFPGPPQLQLDGRGLRRECVEAKHALAMMASRGVALPILRRNARAAVAVQARLLRGVVVQRLRVRIEDKLEFPDHP